MTKPVHKKLTRKQLQERMAYDPSTAPREPRVIGPARRVKAEDYKK